MMTNSASNSASPPVIRRLLRHERWRLADHLLRLSPRDRYMRFGGHVSDDFIRRYAESPEWFRRSILGCFLGNEMIGAADFRLLDGRWPREAELAFSVEAEYQGRGIGTELFRRMAIFARNRGVTRLFIVTLPSNRRMRHIASKFHMVTEPCEGEVEGRLELLWPNPLSLMDEALEEGQAWLRNLSGREQVL